MPSITTGRFISLVDKLFRVASLAEKIPAWFGSAVTRYLAPEIMRIVDERVTKSENSLKELINVRFAALDARIDGAEKRLDARIDGAEKRLDARIDSVDKRLDSLEKRLDLVQRVALLEAKVREIEAKR